MVNNFKDSIKKNIDVKDKQVIEKHNTNVDGSSKFHLSKKKADKTNKKSFPVYMDANLIKELDKLCKKSGYSRNELINIMCSWCIGNLDFTE